MPQTSKLDNIQPPSWLPSLSLPSLSTTPLPSGTSYSFVFDVPPAGGSYPAQRVNLGYMTVAGDLRDSQPVNCATYLSDSDDLPGIDTPFAATRRSSRWSSPSRRIPELVASPRHSVQLHAMCGTEMGHAACQAHVLAPTLPSPQAVSSRDNSASCGVGPAWARAPTSG